MLYIDNLSTDVYFNLATEEYLLKNFESDILMVWQSQPSVVIGRHQSVRAEVDVDYAERNHISIARRYSGGGAVYHDSGNLNLTFIETTDKIGFDKYAAITARALTRLGLEPEVDERRSIYLSGLKVSGSAQCVYKHRLLYHATLLFDADLEKLTKSLDGKVDHTLSERQMNVCSVKSPVTNIKPYLTGLSSLSDFKREIVDSILMDVGSCKDYRWAEKDMLQINRMKNNRYTTSGWNGVEVESISSSG